MKETEVIVHVWCDACFADDAGKVEANDTLTLNLGGLPKTLDMCDRHKKELVTPLADLLTLHGQLTPVAGAKQPMKRATGSTVRKIDSVLWTCPICQTELSRGTAIGHVWGLHRRGEDRSQPQRCPDCLFESDRSQSMSAHRARTHGWDALADALKGADHVGR